MGRLPAQRPEVLFDRQPILRLGPDLRIDAAGNNPAGATIPLEREGLTIKDDWDGFGQRLTGTGTTILDNVCATVLRSENEVRKPRSDPGDLGLGE